MGLCDFSTSSLLKQISSVINIPTHYIHEAILPPNYTQKAILPPKIPQVLVFLLLITGLSLYYTGAWDIIVSEIEAASNAVTSEVVVQIEDSISFTFQGGEVVLPCGQHVQRGG